MDRSCRSFDERLRNAASKIRRQNQSNLNTGVMQYATISIPPLLMIMHGFPESDPDVEQPKAAA